MIYMNKNKLLLNNISISMKININKNKKVVENDY